MNRFFFLLITTLLYFISHHAIAIKPMEHAPEDSIGTERVGGKLFIIHKVEPKETLYAISRKYGVSPEDLINANPGVEEGIKIDQIIKVPATEPSSRKAQKKDKHTVKSGENLFAISKQYGVTIPDIKRWNKLTSDDLRIGQELIVADPSAVSASASTTVKIDSSPSNLGDGGLEHTVMASETLFSISRKYDVHFNDIKKWNNLSSDEIAIGQKLKIFTVGKRSGKTAEEFKDKAVAEKKAPSTSKTVGQTLSTDYDTGFEKINESGLAQVIAKSGDSKKYLGLHRTAPIGTIMQVSNESNDRSVFVRIIGNIPEAGDNERVVIKISQTAYDRLGAFDERFPVKLSYWP
ncbi:MAG: LysM peptidoglycan-binding domain-containing protein [Cyclobacteriaceae bacterium]|nr:LysM peptidoglycan-binding domain-containing protein [Cyclobacteriaceae bacterium]MCH8516991.1 LysM peptidoglycan-binding domain-containing protein [Cyclobacteriaceae bacterium]